MKKKPHITFSFKPFFLVFSSNLLKMMTRSAKRKLQELEGSQTESKCRKSDESDPEISAQLAKARTTKLDGPHSEGTCQF